MKSKLYSCVFAIFMAFCSVSYASDPYFNRAPNLDKCMKFAYSMPDIKNCILRSLDFYENRVQKFYKTAFKKCKRSSNPSQCSTSLRRSQEAWIEYRNLTVNNRKYFYDEDTRSEPILELMLKMDITRLQAIHLDTQLQ